MELTPNKIIMLLKIRKAYMIDQYIKNGFKNKLDLASTVESSYNPSGTLRRFIGELLSEGVLFIQGALKMDIDLCEQWIIENEHYKCVKEFIEENYALVGKGFFNKKI